MTNPIGVLQDELHRLCQRHQALLLNIEQETVHVAIASTMAPELLAALKFASNRRIVIEQWPQAKLEQALGPGGPAAEPQSGCVPSTPATTRPAERKNEEDTPVIHFINQTLRLAFQRRASDIHFEPEAHHYRIRMRVDGVLLEAPSPPVSWAARITARLKIMGQLDIAERRLPQDGQFTFTLDNREYSLRIATLPVLHGEKVVLRILQTHQQPLTLHTLGLSPKDLACLLQSVKQPQGMILVTGPTGSGKTVTLYSAIRWLNDSQRNICSVEDPIEIPLEGINQTALNTKADLDFSRILRALLRQDPDIIMIGEIRDAETAEMAVKAAQTGHLVLSTLHTNSALDTLTRLGNLGIPGYLLASALTLIIAQRLVRQLCTHCRTVAPERLVFPLPLWHEALTHWEAQGCMHCFSGYYGRTALYELLPLTPAMQQALTHNAPTQQLAELATQSGHDTLFSSALHLVAQGVTTISEVYRVIGKHTHDS